MRSRHVDVFIDLDQVRAQAEAIREQTRVALIAVIKADAYGLGAARVADALGSVADDFAYFSLSEAREVGRPGIVLGPVEGEPAEYRELSLRPTIGTLKDARNFAELPVAVELDTGMQRTGCTVAELETILEQSCVHELYTHASTMESVRLLVQANRGRYRAHAASTSLLGEPEAWLDAVRPGCALYRSAVRVSTRLHLVRATQGPVGYTGFRAPHVGVILAGYSHGLAPGPVRINGQRQRILETGMNTSFVSVDAADRAGDEVLLLGDGLTEAEVAAALGIREHAVLCRYCAAGPRRYAVSAPLRATGSRDTTRSSAPGPQRT